MTPHRVLWQRCLTMNVTLPITKRCHLWHCLVMKALRTRKGEYAIYSADYGTNIDDVIGAAMPDHILASEVSQEVRACVLQHPRIVDCSIPGVRHVGDTLYVEIQMQLDTLDEPVLIGASF